MSKSETAFEISQEYRLKEHEIVNIINGVIPEWALPDEAIEQYQAYTGADESFDDTEFAVAKASAAFSEARSKDEEAIRDAVINRKKIPGNEFELKAESDLKGAYTARRVVADMRKQEALKLVAIMRANRDYIYSAMTQRVNAVTPKIRELLRGYEAELAPLLSELEEALTPVALLDTLDSRQREDVGGHRPLIPGPGFASTLARVEQAEQSAHDRAAQGIPEVIRLKDPHGNIGNHQAKGLNDSITASLHHCRIILQC
ncbi:hypothetical protein [Glutamicibacter sp.]|uniref:hypothetical protein n=1 Tax=Glutamicibacter sp. TaxID=1931995 RepID=UPI002FE032FF